MVKNIVHSGISWCSWMTPERWDWEVERSSRGRGYMSHIADSLWKKSKNKIFARKKPSVVKIQSSGSTEMFFSLILILSYYTYDILVQCDSIPLHIYIYIIFHVPSYNIPHYSLSPLDKTQSTTWSLPYISTLLARLLSSLNSCDMFCLSLTI